MVTIGRFGNPTDAEIARGLLKSHGIDAQVADSETASMAWQLVGAMGGVRLLAADDDAHRAKRVLAAADSGVFDVADLPDELAAEEEPEGPVLPEVQALEDRILAADRIFRAALVGALFLPLQFYTGKLLTDFWLGSGPPVPKRQQIRLRVAAVLALTGIVACAVLLRALLAG